MPLNDMEDMVDDGADSETQEMQLGQGTAAESVPSQEDLHVDFPQRDPNRPQLRSAVMLLSSYWHAKYHANKVNELMERSFTQEAMFVDMDSVQNALLGKGAKKQDN